MVKMGFRLFYCAVVLTSTSPAISEEIDPFLKKLLEDHLILAVADSILLDAIS